MILKNEEKNNEKENKYFPYKAFPQQIKLMNFLTEALLKVKNNDIGKEDDKSPKVILIESPTGTGKTMMILSSLINYLVKKNKNRKEEDKEDWLNNFGVNDNEVENTKNQKKKIDEKMDLIITNIKKKIKKKDDNIFDEKEKINKKQNYIMLHQNNFPQIQDQIFFCTRTHSQINQVINEGKILYDYYSKNSSLFDQKSFPFSFIFLGSRKQLCINRKINNNKNSLNKINDLCKEINDKKETRCKYKNFLNEDSIINKVKFICEEMKTEIKDIEDLLKFGEEFNLCPYYATHMAINTSHFVISPYNYILDKRIRKPMNINLDNNIIIFDEAHNIIENILQCANSELNNEELLSLFVGIYLYYNKYKTKINPSNNLCLRQIISIIEILLKFFKKIISNKIKNNENDKELYINIKLSDFTVENKLNSYDFYKLINFIDDYELIYKVQGCLKKELDTIKKDNEYKKKINELLMNKINHFIEDKTINNICEKYLGRYYQILNSNPLNKLCLLLIGTLNVDDDGLLLFDKKLNVLKFILINPIRDFNSLLKEVKCIIFIGGTLKPFDDYYNLFPNVNKDRILIFEGEHIINKGNILLSIIGNNFLCNNQIISFTYESMKINSELNIHYLLKIINDYYSLFKKLNKNGMGIVVFFQSYDLVSKVIDYNNKKQILEIDNNSFFYEKKVEENEKLKNIFESYNENILVKNKISLLFGVMGGKLSEGINFKDNLCRLLIIVGMPFSSIKSIEIIEKMKYYDKLYKEKKSIINGNEYYENLCMKNINQTIGRCIRNYYDFSSIILIDNRFTYNKYYNKLPKWVIREGKNIIKNKQEFDNHLLNIETFLNQKFK